MIAGSEAGSNAVAARAAPISRGATPGQEQGTSALAVPAPFAEPHLGVRAYWALTAVVVMAYLTLWLTHWADVYGWAMDDLVVFNKAVETAADWKQAFTAHFNALQSYFFLVSYVPVKLGWSVPSYPLASLGDQTGAYRFLHLCMVGLHAALLVVWAWFAIRLTPNRLAALGSVLLLATSPTYTLWSPQTDSRFVGLPLALVGLALLWRATEPGRWSPGRAAAACALAGTLLWIAQNLHYTVLYLVAPTVAVLWGVRLSHGWRQRAPWLEALAFVAGVAWLQALLEAVSYFLVGIPWQEGPTQSMFRLRTLHQSPWPLDRHFGLWGEWLVTQMGPLLIVAGLAGWLLCAWQALRARRASPTLLTVFTIAVPLSLAYLLASGSMPFFRQTVPLQPFWFLFVSLAIAAVVARIGGPLALRQVAPGVLLLLVGASQWQQANVVFAAHQGLGRALAWVDAHRGNRPVYWLPIYGFDAQQAVASGAALAGADPLAWVVSYFPWMFLAAEPSLREPLQSVAPVAAWPSLFATAAIRAETRAFAFPDDYAHDALLRDVRVWEVGALQAALRGAPLAVTSVTADSAADATTASENVFDHDRAADGSTAWLSADGPGPHWVEVRFAAPASLDGADVILASGSYAPKGSRIASLDVQVPDDGGTLHSIWRGEGLETQPLVAARWPRLTAGALRFVVERQQLATGAPAPAAVEEIVFPGYTVTAPRRQVPPRLLEPGPVSTRAGQGFGYQADGTAILIVRCQAASEQATLMWDDLALDTTKRGDCELQGRVPAPLYQVAGDHALWLRDGAQESNRLPFRVEP